MNPADLAEVVSMEKNISMWPRDYFCKIMLKNMAVFLPLPKSLPEAEVKIVRSIALIKEVSKVPVQMLHVYKSSLL